MHVRKYSPKYNIMQCNVCSPQGDERTHFKRLARINVNSRQLDIGMMKDGCFRFSNH